MRAVKFTRQPLKAGTLLLTCDMLSRRPNSAPSVVALDYNGDHGEVVWVRSHVEPEDAGLHPIGPGTVMFVIDAACIPVLATYQDNRDALENEYYNGLDAIDAALFRALGVSES